MASNSNTQSTQSTQNDLESQALGNPPPDQTPPAPPAPQPPAPPASEESKEKGKGKSKAEGKDYLAEAYKLMGLNLDELVPSSPRHSDARAYAARLQAADEASAAGQNPA